MKKLTTHYHRLFRYNYWN